MPNALASGAAVRGPTTFARGASSHLTGVLEGALEMRKRVLRPAAVVQVPAQVVVKRDSPAPGARLSGALEHGEADLGPFLLVPGVRDGEHVQGVEGEEGHAPRRRP